MPFSFVRWTSEFIIWVGVLEVISLLYKLHSVGPGGTPFPPFGDCDIVDSHMMGQPGPDCWPVSSWPTGATASWSWRNRFNPPDTLVSFWTERDTSTRGTIDSRVVTTGQGGICSKNFYSWRLILSDRWFDNRCLFKEILGNSMSVDSC